MKFMIFSWAIFSLLDPDPDCESGYGSRDPSEFGSDPDPQHWFRLGNVHYLPTLPKNIGQIRGILAYSMRAKIPNYWDRYPSFVCLSRENPLWSSSEIPNRIKIEVLKTVMSTVQIQNWLLLSMEEKLKGLPLFIQVKVHIKCGVAHLGPRNLAPDPVSPVNP